MTFTEAKFENVVLHGLFAACLLVCGLILTAMVVRKPVPAELAGKLTISHPVSTLLASAPSACMALVSNTVCLGKVG